MADIAPLNPCPNCGFVNQEKVVYETKRIYGRLTRQPWIDTRVNCARCGMFYNGRNEHHNFIPQRYWVINAFINLGQFFLGLFIFLLLAAIIGSAIYVISFYYH